MNDRDLAIAEEPAMIASSLPQSQKTSLLFSSKNILMSLMVVLLGLSLSGCVGAVAGVGAAAVAAGNTEKGLGTSIADGVIKVKIADRFIQSNASLFTNVSVSVNDGAVLLTGAVEKPEHKVEATQLTWQTRGVIEVINEIEVNDKSSLKDIAKDLAAAAQLRAKLIAEQGVSSINFSVDVVNGTVFLTGIASSETEMNTVVRLAQELRFATDVVNYIRVSDDDRE